MSIENPYQLIRKSDLIAAVPERWREQYENYIDDSKKKITDALEALKPEELTEVNVIKIIGNRYWTANDCNICGGDNEVLIRIGEEPDYESTTITICQGCLEGAKTYLENGL